MYRIFKSPVFACSGKVVISTFRKASYRAQFLPTVSAHKLSVKSSIVKGEATRFLINDITPEAFRDDAEFFKRALAARGYAAALQLVLMHDSEKRFDEVSG